MSIADQRFKKNEHDRVSYNFHTEEIATRVTNTFVKEQLSGANTTAILEDKHYHPLSKTNFNTSKTNIQPLKNNLQLPTIE